MGNVSHLCVSLLATVAPTCFRTASLDDTPGEQMCSNESILNSDVGEAFGFFSCYSAQYALIRSRARRSRLRNKPFLWQRDKMHKYSLMWKLKLLFFGRWGVPCFFFNDTFILMIIRVPFFVVFTPEECVMFRLTFQLYCGY